MSSPSENSPEQSVSVSSPAAADGTMEDSASSTRGTGPPQIVTVQSVYANAPPSSPRQVVPAAPNAAYSSRLRDVRSRSASPRPRRTITPTELSVAQQRARTAELKADTAYSGVGMVADQTRHARSVAETAIAEARAVREQVESKISEVAKRMNVSASGMAENVEGRMREVAAHTEAHTSHAVGTLEVKTREYVEGQRRELEAKIDRDRAEARRTAEENRAAFDNMSAQLSQLALQFAERPAMRTTTDVAMGPEHAQLVPEVNTRLQLQSQRIDTISDSVQRMERDSADNTKLLHELIVSMENMGESVKFLKAEVAASWGQEEDVVMETSEDRQYKELQQTMLAEVSSAFPATMTEENPAVTTPMAISTPLATPILTEASTSSLPSGATTEMKDRLDAIRQPATSEEKNEKEQKNIPFQFTPISSPLYYPGLDGHPRRIVPTPILTPEIPTSAMLGCSPDKQLTFEEEVEEMRKRRDESVAKLEMATSTVNVQKSEKNIKMGEQVKDRANDDAALRSPATSQYSGTHRSTIGDTTISTAEAATIRREVRGALQQAFPGIQFSTGQPSENFDQSGSETQSVPVAIAGSDVSVASTQAPNRAEESKFSRMMSGAGTVVPTQTFATAQWRPKEPPCYYGRSNEDVHMWTSLVRHYFTFMGGSDVQQVSYAVTLLRDSAHEWYAAYERRHRQMPRDWAQLSTALLERFGSNIRSQEAQSQLMSISQGARPVREYASQFETLLGRLDSYDESMLLNQFVWGLHPELARSVSLHYPKSIAQAVSLAETTELAVKASRRPTGQGQKSGRAPMSQNRGRGRGGYRGRGGGYYRGGSSAGSGGRKSGGGRGNAGRRGSSSSVNFDPLACYRCGVRGHLARDCPQTGYAQSQGSGNAGPSRGKFSQSGQKGPQRGRGRGRQVRFGALNVLYDGDGNEYPVDDAGQLYVPLDFGYTVAEEGQEENDKDTKN